MTTGQISPDGKWQWNGSEWVTTTPASSPAPGASKASREEKLGLRPDLAAAISGRNSLVGLKKPLKTVNDSLLNSETVVAAVGCQRKNGKNLDNGIMVVTNQRLLFVHARGFATATEELSMANISGITDRKGLAFSKLIVTGSGGITTEFHQIAKQYIDPVLLAIRSHINAPRGASVASTAAAAPDPVEQIRKLGELRDAGIVTEEEFAAKKAELLARM